MDNQSNTKPYFEGQHPAQCGHYYPDVLRVRDEKRNGEFFRVLDCSICKTQYETPIEGDLFNPNSLEGSLGRETLEQYRSRERNRILSKK